MMLAPRLARKRQLGTTGSDFSKPGPDFSAPFVTERLQAGVYSPLNQL